MFPDYLSVSYDHGFKTIETKEIFKTINYINPSYMKNIFTSKANTKTVRSYHVTYSFQSESTLYSCLNVKELPA